MSDLQDLHAYVRWNCRQAEQHPKIARRITDLTAIEMEKDPHASTDEIMLRVKADYKQRYIQRETPVDGETPKGFILTALLLQIFVSVIASLIAKWIVKWWQEHHAAEPHTDAPLLTLYAGLRQEAEAELNVEV